MIFSVYATCLLFDDFYELCISYIIAGIMPWIISHEAKRFVEKFSIFFIIYTYWMQDEVLLAVMKGLNFILLNKNEVFCKVPKN